MVLTIDSLTLIRYNPETEKAVTLVGPSGIEGEEKDLVAVSGSFLIANRESAKVFFADAGE